MKAIVIVMMLSTGITGTIYAQTNAEKVFDLPDSYVKRRFAVDIGRGNKMQIELDNIADLKHLTNIDSLLRLFIRDIQLFSDSLADELTSKRIDYIIDTTAARKIRISRTLPRGANFAISQGETAALKLDQDTIHFKGTVYGGPPDKRFSLRNFRLSFFLNDISEINDYVATGLNEKVTRLRDNISSKWIPAPNRRVALKAEPSITANTAKGYVAGGDYLNIRFSVDIQNYKNYFVPSFSLGAGLILTNQGFFKRDITLSWDPNFLFAKNDEGKLKMYRNDFLSLTWGQGVIRNNEPRKESHFMFIASFGYLIHRSGEFYTKNTMRLAAGRLSLFEGKTKIEPGMYFNDLFKGVTPAIRLIQTF